MTPPETTNATDRSGDTESSTPTSEPLGRIDTTSDMPSQSPLPFPLPKDFLRMDEHVPRADLPSMYLQRRCPLCFSGRPNLRTSACVWNSEAYTGMITEIPISAQVIVCVDANFSQRRRHSRHSDPVDPHPDTHFLSEDDVESMRRVVENARPTDSRSNAKSWAKLPNDTLDDCEKAFTAAQGHIAKSSSAIFADTALMALLCRHDRPLFLVNMTSAGERQFYALALIKALFQHLPDNWVVGFLYDVACQLERSMRKVCGQSAIAVPGLSQAIAWLLTRICGSHDFCGFGLSCIWPPMGLSARLPPAKIQGLRPFRWGGLRTALERNSQNGTFSPLSWGMYTASTYLTQLKMICSTGGAYSNWTLNSFGSRIRIYLN